MDIEALTSDTSFNSDDNEIENAMLETSKKTICVTGRSASSREQTWSGAEGTKLFTFNYVLTLTLKLDRL